MVVLPTPGPPVITKTFDCRDRRMAARWLAANARPVFRSIHGSALSGSMGGPWQLSVDQAPQPLSNALLGPIKDTKKHTSHAANRVGNDCSLRQLKIQVG
jgi:hypothetical protein